jgi:hypothetical protein
VGVLEIMLAGELTHQHTVIGAFPRIRKTTSEVDLPAVSQLIGSQVHRPEAEGLRSSIAILNLLPTVEPKM